MHPGYIETTGRRLCHLAVINRVGTRILNHTKRAASVQAICQRGSGHRSEHVSAADPSAESTVPAKELACALRQGRSVKHECCRKVKLHPLLRHAWQLKLNNGICLRTWLPTTKGGHTLVSAVVGAAVSRDQCGEGGGSSHSGAGSSLRFDLVKESADSIAHLFNATARAERHCIQRRFRILGSYDLHGCGNGSMSRSRPTKTLYSSHQLVDEW